MNERYADLHVHTHFSDGTFSPEEVTRTAKEKGLAAIAICDHDSVDGVSPCIELAGEELEIIPGVELTVIKERREVHILGYFVSWKEKWFVDTLKDLQKKRVKRMRKMIEKLAHHGINIDAEELLEESGQGSVGRLHLARKMAETGQVPFLQTAFDKYIGDLKPCYVEDIGFEASQAVDTIIKAGGVPVIAHPAILGNDDLVRKFIRYGIRGIEAFHIDQSSSVSKKYQKMAEENHLLITGGSDCHGLAKKEVLMGKVKVPYSVVERLKEERDRIRNKPTG